jgi:Tfp pilus assembly protein PilF
VLTLIKSISAALLALVVGFSLGGCQQEILSHNPQSRAAGMKEFQEGNYADAAGAFRNAVRADPRDYKSQFYLAQCYEKMNQPQQAMQAYKTSLDAQPRTLAGQEDKAQRITTIEALAACISKSDQRDAEVNKIEQSARGSNNPQDYLLLAKIYQNRGDADSALDAYNRSSLSASQDFTVLKEYGLYLEQLGQGPRATVQLKKAYRMNPNDEQVNAALYRLHVIPGPGLKEEAQLTKPPLPQGPLPEVDLSKFRIGGSNAEPQQAEPAPQAQPPAATPPPTNGGLPSVPRAESAPRD